MSRLFWAHQVAARLQPVLNAQHCDGSAAHVIARQLQHYWEAHGIGMTSHQPLVWLAPPSPKQIELAFAAYRRTHMAVTQTQAGGANIKYRLCRKSCCQQVYSFHRKSCYHQVQVPQEELQTISPEITGRAAKHKYKNHRQRQLHTIWPLPPRPSSKNAA